MEITVHLHTILQRQTPGGLLSRLEVVMPLKSTLGDLLEHLEIDLSPDAILLVVNRRMADIDSLLKDGDVVNLMPAISGGCPSKPIYVSCPKTRDKYGG